MDKKNRKKHRYVQTLGIVVIVLALVRCAFPGIANQEEPSREAMAPDSLSVVQQQPVTTAAHEEAQRPVPTTAQTIEAVNAPQPLHPHRVRGVVNYDQAFPDSNHVQLLAAQQWGVTPVKNRANAELRKNEVVFMGQSPYYDVAHLDASIPYLVPRAALLLDDIGRLFFDSLQTKGLPLHRMVVSSVLRSEEDVMRLRRSNHNATAHSCHLYGTTFDINYTQYNPVAGRTADSERLKMVLSEVLHDLRTQQRCYIKYEHRQPCFHITVR